MAKKPSRSAEEPSRNAASARGLKNRDVWGWFGFMGGVIPARVAKLQGSGREVSHYVFVIHRRWLGIATRLAYRGDAHLHIGARVAKDGACLRRPCVGWRAITLP